MSQLHLNQIRARITERFASHAEDLRISDASADPNRFLSRALAALALQRFADLSIQDAARAVTDDQADGGIDALYFASDSATLYIVQSKWKNETNGGISLGEILKYTGGIRKLLQSDSAYFGGPIAARWSEIESALVQLSRVLVIFTYSSEASLDDKQTKALDEVLSEFNQPSEVASLRISSQREVHEYLASGVEGDDIDETIRLFQWGCLDQPHIAFYGQMAASDLTALARKYGRRLFSSNIRQFLGRGGTVNQEIAATASQRPELFWYFNNGVTMTARSAKKTAIGGARRDVADVVCDALSIVNGAQTVGALTNIVGEDANDVLQRIMVPVRVISLESGGSELGVEITRATNTQNRVDGRNFVALNPLHQRIRRDLLMDGVTYVIQQTDLDERGPKVFAVSEAFAAMACALPGIEPCVLAKREISRLWENLDSDLHAEMFPDDISATAVWRNVQVVRMIDQEIATARVIVDSSRERTVLSHGNRLAAHIAFRLMPSWGITTDKDLENLAYSVVIHLGFFVSDVYSDQYPAVIFKNNEDCKAISDGVFEYMLERLESLKKDQEN